MPAEWPAYLTAGLPAPLTMSVFGMPVVLVEGHNITQNSPFLPPLWSWPCLVLIFVPYPRRDGQAELAFVVVVD